MSAIFSLVSLLILIFLLPTCTTAQAEFIFAYYKEDTGCTEAIQPASLHNQGIPTTSYGQCVPVLDAQNGTFDVSISGLVYWTDTVTPIIKACPTIDCDYYADNGCCKFLAAAGSWNVWLRRSLMLGGCRYNVGEGEVSFFEGL